MARTPFDYIKAIQQTKENLAEDPNDIIDYNPFIVNRGLAYYRDCLYFANEMNRRPWLDKEMQFSFYLNTVRRMKRPYVKWVKTEKSKDLECIKKIYKCSNQKAFEILNLLTEEQLQIIKNMSDEGGVGKKRNG